MRNFVILCGDATSGGDRCDLHQGTKVPGSRIIRFRFKKILNRYDKYQTILNNTKKNIFLKNWTKLAPWVDL